MPSCKKFVTCDHNLVCMKQLYPMKRIAISFLFLLSTLSLTAQVQLVNSVIASAGRFSTSGSITLSWTLGEMAVKTLAGTNLMLNQGFQQPWELIIDGGTPIQEPELNWSVKAFPNPVRDNLNVEFTLEKSERFSMEILDITGKKIYQREAETIMPDQTIQLDFSSYKEGIYILRVVSEDQKTHKIYKIRKN